MRYFPNCPPGGTLSVFELDTAEQGGAWLVTSTIRDLGLIRAPYQEMELYGEGQQAEFLGKAEAHRMASLRLRSSSRRRDQSMNKYVLRETMLTLSAAELESAHDKYQRYLESARLDRSEPIENDEHAQAEISSDVAEAFDDTLHDYSRKIEKLKSIDFGPKSIVSEGAVVKLSGRHFVIAVSTDKFVCHGHEMMGISTAAPIYAAIEGAGAGDVVQFKGKKLVIQDVL